MKGTIILMLFFFAGMLPAKGQITEKSFQETLDRLYAHSIPLISVKDLASIPQKDKVYLIDIRSKEEYAVSHLPGARFADYDTFDPSALKDIPKDAKIVVYCSVGYRSEKAGEKLKAAGYQDVQNLYGGIFEWVNQGHPVEQDGKQVNVVHTYDEKWSVWLIRGEKVW